MRFIVAIRETQKGLYRLEECQTQTAAQAALEMLGTDGVNKEEYDVYQIEDAVNCDQFLNDGIFDDFIDE